MAKKNNSGFYVTKGFPVPLGVTVLKEETNFSVSVPGCDACTLNLYEKNTGTLKESVPLMRPQNGRSFNQ